MQYYLYPSAVIIHIFSVSLPSPLLSRDGNLSVQDLSFFFSIDLDSQWIQMHDYPYLLLVEFYVLAD